MHEAITSVLQALRLSERLKFELRHSWLSNGRRESVAEHCWQMAFMAMLVHPFLKQKPDLERSLKMTIVHDLVEALVGDVPFFESGPRQDRKAAREQEAITELCSKLPPPVGKEVSGLWHEFEERKTPESLLVKALDTLEVQVQHNMADISTWIDIEHELVYTKMDAHCQHDPFLQELCSAIKGEAEEKLVAAGVDVDAIKSRGGTR
jgi:5'-deoxynucleotidase YfbR-like HD superfamily hydrolase